MKQRKQNKNLASSDKTTIVLFVIQLFLLFDKTESGEPGEPSESGEPSDSTDSTDSTDSMHSDILARSAKINISAVGTTLPILARRAVIFSAKRGPTEPSEPTEPTALLVSASMQFSLKFSISIKRSAPPASRQTDSTDSMHSDILVRSAKINISAVGTTLPILARRAVIFSAKRGPTEPSEPTALLVSASMQFSSRMRKAMHSNTTTPFSTPMRRFASTATNPFSRWFTTLSNSISKD